MIVALARKLRDLAVYLIVSAGFFPAVAHAYVDPGSGSVIVGTVLGFIAAISYTFRKFFYNLKAKIFGSDEKREDRSLDD